MERTAVHLGCRSSACHNSLLGQIHKFCQILWSFSPVFQLPRMGQLECVRMLPAVSSEDFRTALQMGDDESTSLPPSHFRVWFVDGLVLVCGREDATGLGNQSRTPRGCGVGSVRDGEDRPCSPPPSQGQTALSIKAFKPLHVPAFLHSNVCVCCWGVSRFEKARSPSSPQYSSLWWAALSCPSAFPCP